MMLWVLCSRGSAGLSRAESGYSASHRPWARRNLQRAARGQAPRQSMRPIGDSDPLRDPALRLVSNLLVGRDGRSVRGDGPLPTGRGDGVRAEWRPGQGRCSALVVIRLQSRGVGE
jgi:hypothetical protein